MVKNSQPLISISLFFTTIDFSHLIYLFMWSKWKHFSPNHYGIIYFFYSTLLAMETCGIISRCSIPSLALHIAIRTYIYWCYWDLFKARGRRAGVLVPSSETFHEDLLSLTSNSCHSRVWKIWFGCQNSKQWVNE